MADIVGTITTENTLSGNLNAIYAKDGLSAYEVALANGFEGTEAEWLESLHGEDGYTPVKGVDYIDGKDGYTPVKGVDYFDGVRGEKGDKGNSGVYLGSGEMPSDCNVQIDPKGAVLTLEEIVASLAAKAHKISSVTLYANKWEGTASPYYQSVIISGTTPNSRVDLNPTIEQLNIFYNKDISFVVENNDGDIIVYCIGQKPTNNYTMQATIMEVVVNG